MVDRYRTARGFEVIQKLAAERAEAVLRCVDTLVPDGTPQRKKRLCNRILSMCDGKDRSVRITQDQARELISPHLQCIKPNCALLCFWEPISRSLNLFFNEEE